MNISIFGLGYVGCVSLGCLAQDGHKIIGIDIFKKKVDLINKGKPTIIEKDLDRIIFEQFKLGNIYATTDFYDAIQNSELSFICVGTPSTKEGHLNMQNVYNVLKEIGQALKTKSDFHIISIRSTIIPGTFQRVKEILEDHSGKQYNKDFSIILNPEFLREGSAINDYYNPPFTVLAGDNQSALNKMMSIYGNINAPFEVVKIEVAEIIKLINNSFHALKITFANEIGNICKKLNIDSHEVMELFCKDHHLNISANYLKPGFAYGGSCLPKDLKGINTIAHDNYLITPVISAIEESNSNQKIIACDIIKSYNKYNIGILGVSFKQGTDDLRNSPIVEVIELLLGKGFIIRIYDENVNISNLSGINKTYFKEHIPHLKNLICNDIYKVVEESEIIVITQNDLRFRELINKYPTKIFIDLIRILDSKSNNNYEGICW